MFCAPVAGQALVDLNKTPFLSRGAPSLVVGCQRHILCVTVPDKGSIRGLTEVGLQGGAHDGNDRLLSQRNGTWSGRISPAWVGEPHRPQGSACADDQAACFC